MDVFAHVCQQKAITSINYFHNIQPYDKTFLFLSNLARFLDFFLEITTISYF